MLDNISETCGCPSAHAFNLAVDKAVSESDLDQAESYVWDMLSTFNVEDGRGTDAPSDTACYGKTNFAIENSRATNTVSGIEISNVLRSHLRRKVQCFYTQEALAVSEYVRRHKQFPKILYQIQ